MLLRPISLDYLCFFFFFTKKNQEKNFSFSISIGHGKMHFGLKSKSMLAYYIKMASKIHTRASNANKKKKRYSSRNIAFFLKWKFFTFIYLYYILMHECVQCMVIIINVYVVHTILVCLTFQCSIELNETLPHYHALDMVRCNDDFSMINSN